jgi:medium-chain acyl-[acyl-carrier-protein] hydrolase
MFHGWSGRLTHDVDVCAVQLPGRESRLMDPPIVRLPILIEQLSEVLLPYLDIPFAFFGHSMGALIGFEMARQLRKQGHPEPVHLFVSSCRAPQLNRISSWHSELDLRSIQALRHLTSGQAGELARLMGPTIQADLSMCEAYRYTSERPLDCAISAFGGSADPAISRDALDHWQDQTEASFRLEQFPGDHAYLEAGREALLRCINEDVSRY